MNELWSETIKLIIALAVFAAFFFFLGAVFRRSKLIMEWKKYSRHLDPHNLTLAGYMFVVLIVVFVIEAIVKSNQ